MGVERIILGLILFLFTFPKIAPAEDNEELKFGFYVDREVVSSQTILFNKALNLRIAEIGKRIVKVSDKPDMKYIFRVINDPTINAYSAAGGFAYINTGLLDILESEDELASVMAHEIPALDLDSRPVSCALGLYATEAGTPGIREKP